MWERGLDDVEGAGEVCFELVPDFVFVLVFAGADEAVAMADCYDVDVAEAEEGVAEGCFDAVADADVTGLGVIGLVR